MDKILKKDIVIPAGRVFFPAANISTRMSGNYYECIVELSDNTSGSFVYCIDEDLEVLDDYFGDVE